MAAPPQTMETMTASALRYPTLVAQKSAGMGSLVPKVAW